MPRQPFEIVKGPIDAIAKSERIRRFYRYWTNLAGDGVPTRGMIDPAKIKDLLSHIMIVEFIGEPFRVRYRLVGTEVVAYTGLEFTGRYLDELEMDDFTEAEVVAAYRLVRSARCPGMGVTEFRVEGKRMLLTEYLICPLLTAGGEIGQCIVVEDYFLSSGAFINELPPARLR